MKNFLLLLIIVMITFPVIVEAQAPQIFNYQAIVRDGNGDIVANQNVSFQVSILAGSVTGTIMYSETHSVNTNSFGLATFAVGSGTLVTGDFTNINWGTDLYFLKIGADITGGTTYIDMGTTQLLSVPYALYAERASTSTDDNDHDPLNEIQDISISGNDLTISGGSTVTIPQATYTAGTGINITGNIVTNTLPDDTVTITGIGSTTVTGTYPDFVVSGTDNVNDADADPSNELQILSVNNDTLFLTNGGFVPLSGYSDTLWRLAGVNIYNTNSGKVGIGTATPPGKLVVQGDSTMADTIPLFEVKDKSGHTVFIIYPDSARLYVGDDGSKTIKGGFAVSGRNTVKQITHNYLLVKPDSTRIYTTDTVAGFGVENITASSTNSYMKLTPANYFIGHEAGKSVTSGLFNSFIGYQSGYSNATGKKNYLIGYRAGYYNYSGNSNIFIGDSAGYNNQPFSAPLGSMNGCYNIFVGNESGLMNYTGYANIFIGYNAGRENTSGHMNAAVGYRALFSNTTGYNNSAFGYDALYLNSTGLSNTAIGTGGLSSNVSGRFNTAVGCEALKNNTVSYNNTALGTYALRANTGENNTACGMIAIGFNQTGSDNTAVGSYALSGITTGNWNSALGSNSYATNNYSNSTALGATTVITASNQIRLGNASVTSIGGYADWTNISDKRVKKDISENVPGLEFILKLKPVTYHLDLDKIAELTKLPDSLRQKDNEKITENILQTGFLAQDVEKVAKELGYEFSGVDAPKNENDFYGLRYAEFTVPLVKAVQELSEQNRKLAEENKQQQLLIENLIKKVGQLEK